MVTATAQKLEKESISGDIKCGLKSIQVLSHGCDKYRMTRSDGPKAIWGYDRKGLSHESKGKLGCRVKTPNKKARLTPAAESKG